ALRLGAIYAGESEEITEVLGAYSEALGIAYQIRDDLSDLGSEGETNDIAAMRPSLLLAIAWERAEGEQKASLESLWRRSLPAGTTTAQIETLYGELKDGERARQLYETYKDEAIRSVRVLEKVSVK